MAAPAEFIVARHLLEHPTEAQADVARHVHLDPAVVSRCVQRMRNQGIQTGHQRFEHLRSLSRRVIHRRVHIKAPNPSLWFQAYKGPFWASGEIAAAEVDRIDVVPQRLLVYVPEDRVDVAIRAALDIFGRVSGFRDSNLEIRVQDSWLNAGENPHVVERGQRLLDYLESPNIQLLRGLELAV